MTDQRSEIEALKFENAQLKDDLIDELREVNDLRPALKKARKEAAKNLTDYHNSDADRIEMKNERDTLKNTLHNLQVWIDRICEQWNVTGLTAVEREHTALTAQLTALRQRHEALLAAAKEAENQLRLWGDQHPDDEIMVAVILNLHTNIEESGQ